MRHNGLSATARTDVEGLLQFLIHNGRTWIREQQQQHRPSAAVLPPQVRTHFGAFFPDTDLNAARFADAAGIENPPFYAQLAAMGIPAPLDFAQMEAITFIDTILISRGAVNEPAAMGQLLFHELIHVVQYRLLGPDEFVERYVLGWAEGGQDYYRIPLEQDAYALQERYDGSRDRPFAVEPEVRRLLQLR